MTIAAAAGLEPQQALLDQAGERRARLRRQSGIRRQPDPGQADDATVIELQQVAGQHAAHGQRLLADRRAWPEDEQEHEPEKAQR